MGASESMRVREGQTNREDDRVVRVRGEVPLDILLDEPGHQRLPIADDEIVDRASLLPNVSGREITLVTDDVGQAHRARMAGLSVSMVAEPIYDIDVQEQARAEKQAAKDRQRAAEKTRRQQDRKQDPQQGVALEPQNCGHADPARPVRLPRSERRETPASIRQKKTTWSYAHQRPAEAARA